jgi:DNA-binding winged helix-turn-helix (wHTH) protein
VDTQVLTLRRKLEQAGLGEGGGIETMRQQGYRFSLETLSDGDSGVSDRRPSLGTLRA